MTLANSLCVTHNLWPKWHYLCTVFFLPHRFITVVHFSEVKVVIGKIQSCLFWKKSKKWTFSDHKYEILFKIKPFSLNSSKRLCITTNCVGCWEKDLPRSCFDTCRHSRRFWSQGWGWWRSWHSQECTEHWSVSWTWHHRKKPRTSLCDCAQSTDQQWWIHTYHWHHLYIIASGGWNRNCLPLCSTGNNRYIVLIEFSLHLMIYTYLLWQVHCFPGWCLLLIFLVMVSYS